MIIANTSTSMENICISIFLDIYIHYYLICFYIFLECYYYKCMIHSIVQKITLDTKVSFCWSAISF